MRFASGFSLFPPPALRPPIPNRYPESMAIHSQQRQMLNEGAQAPELNFETLAGGTTTLSEIRSKGPALLAFYKISCPTCQLTFPYLERLSKNKNFQVIGICQDEPAGAVEFNKVFHIHFPILLDTEQSGYAAGNAFGISHVPSLFVVEPDGKISVAEQGFTKPLLEELGERAGITVFTDADTVPLYKPG